jgi:hypothetical protein
VRRSATQRSGTSGRSCVPVPVATSSAIFSRIRTATGSSWSSFRRVHPRTRSLSASDSLRRDPDEQLPGADSLLGYHPGQEHPFGGEGDAPDWYPIPSHVVLFHELLHAEHHQSGTAAHNTDGKRHNHDEENLTTGTHDTLEPYLNENRYRAERRELGDELPEREWYFKP